MKERPPRPPSSDTPPEEGNSKVEGYSLFGVTKNCNAQNPPPAEGWIPQSGRRGGQVPTQLMKTIVILSPDTWGRMMLSKMHFAKELAKEGNQAFFINPPRKNLSDGKAKKIENNLTVISLKEHPLRIFAREKCRPLYRWIERKFIREILRATGHIDELWCFNAFFISDLKFFGADKTLLFVYDLYVPENLHKAALQADGIVSIAQEILNEFKETGKPQLLIHHGLSPAFQKMAESGFTTFVRRGKIKVGYTGNLMRQGIDREIFRKIISTHPDLEFHFWGATEVAENNLMTNTPSGDVTEFINFLRLQKNVFLHGVKDPEKLAKEMRGMDAFLFLYNVKQDINAGYNSHKLMEYLATGKTVFSPYVSRFAETGLMVMDTKEGTDFESFFDRQLPILEKYNQTALQQKRISFALDNTYRKQVERIREWILLQP